MSRTVQYAQYEEDWGYKYFFRARYCAFSKQNQDPVYREEEGNGFGQTTRSIMRAMVKTCSANVEVECFKGLETLPVSIL